MKLVIETLPIRDVISLRDRAVLALMVHANVSPQSIIRIAAKDYFGLGDRFWIRHVDDDNRIVRHTELAPPVKQYIDEYLTAAHIEHELDRPLFRVTYGRGRLGFKSLSWGDIQRAIKRSIELYNLGRLIKTIRSDNTVNLRDRAIIGLLLHTSATPANVCRMQVGDYLVDQTGKPYIKIGQTSVLLPPSVIPLMSRYLAKVPWATRSGFLLFQLNRGHHMMRSDIREMIETRRALARECLYPSAKLVISRYSSVIRAASDPKSPNS